MKNLIALLLLFSFAAQAGLPPTTATGLMGGGGTTFGSQYPGQQVTPISGTTRLIETGNGNLLSNPNFQAGTVLTGWTSSAGTTSASTSTVLPGYTQSLSLALSSQAAGLYQDATPVSSLTGVNLETTLWVNTTVSGLQVCPRVAGTLISSSCATVPNGGYWTPVAVNIPGSGTSTVGVELYSSSSLTGTVYVSGGYVGVARNIGTIQQSYFFGSYYQSAGSSSCGYSATTTGETNWITIANGSGCGSSSGTSTGGVSNSSYSSALQVTLTGVQPGGTYYISLGLSVQSPITPSSLAHLQFYDSSNSVGFGHTDVGLTAPPSSATQASNGGTLTGAITYTAAQVTAHPNPVITVQVAATSGTVYVLNNGSSGHRDLEWDVTYLPSYSQQGYLASSGGLNPGEESITAATSCPIGTIPEDGTSYLRTTYSALFNAIGTTYGSVDGTHFNVPDARGVFERAAGTNGTITTANGGAMSATQGSNQNDMFQGHWHSGQSGSDFVSYTGSGSFALSGGGNETLFAQTGSPYTDGTNGTPRTGAETRPASISHLHCIRYIAATPAPVINNSITTNATGAWRVESENITIASSSSCTFSGGTGFITSAVANANGECTATFASAFSSTPVCVISQVFPSGQPVGYSFSPTIISTTTSTIHFTESFTTSGGSTISYYNGTVSVLCYGPR